VMLRVENIGVALRACIRRYKNRELHMRQVIHAVGDALDVMVHETQCQRRVGSDRPPVDLTWQTDHCVSMTTTIHHEHGSLASSLGAGAGAHALVVLNGPNAKQVIPAAAYERRHDHAAIVRLDVDGCP